RKAYRALVHTFHDSAEAPQAQLMYAKLLLEKGKHIDAFEEFQYLVKFYAGKLPYEEILTEQFKIANYIRGENEQGMAIAGASTSQCLPLYRTIIKNAPDWDRAPEAQFILGAVHEGRKEYKEAIESFESVMLRYPKSAFVANAAYHRAHCLYAISNRSPRDADSGQQALTALIGFLRDYPSDPNADAARQSRDEMKQRLSELYYTKAIFYDRIAKKPQAAVIAYTDFLNRFPTSDKQDEVQKRVTVLQQIEELKQSE
ncbi:MAG: outer membrane protein assembly factor BamD, partial [Verrucomicrobia bacterium]|nr:outer membrane protein assembly factor BamD [Verrucomicrobiota bacterium]